MGNCKSKKIPPELLDLSNMTHFSKNELQRWYAEFLRNCPNGLLNVDQFVEIYSSLFDSTHAKKFARHVFRTFDNNDDNCLDFREFICSLSITSRGTTEEKLAWVFNLYDIDGDGRITKTEMMQIIRQIQQISRAQYDARLSIKNVSNAFDDLDKNADGSITRQEFIQGVKEHPLLALIAEAYAPK